MRAWICSAGFAAIATLSACATPTLYQPATGPAAQGYSEMAIEERRYRVSFRSGSDTSVEASRDFALRRAADLTIENGYDWFAVTDRITEPAVGGGGPRFSVGLGGADFGSSSAIGGGVGVGFGGRSQTGYVTTLEIVMGAGPKPESPDAYDARSVALSLSGV